ncbi:MAG: HAMP domain-containing histidine kinase [Bacilli bacterium]|nr:HAMP domain-containing histidine kinase [Bacilli bacterium]
MQLFETIILTSIYILFPIMAYLLYIVYTKNLDINERKELLELALLSSIFLLVKLHNKDLWIYQLLLINVPLLVAYLKKRKDLSIIISIIVIVLSYIDFNINIVLLIIEYIIYYVLFIKTVSFNKFINRFLIIKAFIISLEIFIYIMPHASFMYNVFLIFMEMIILSVTTYIITELIKKVEETVNLNITLRELEKEKALRESLFKMTHEIKNPIAVCKGYIDMMKKDNIKEENREKYLNIIDEEISRTLILMDDFLDYTKIKINKEEMDINVLIEEVITNSNTLLKKNNVKVETDIKSEEIIVNADYNRLKQVLVNILKNSLEAKKVKDKMLINIKVTNSTNEVKIVIKDNGIGMDKKTLNKINKMFFTTKSKGTGLGVPLSKEIIELHSGTIKYRSIPNKGTTVSITLPK